MSGAPAVVVKGPDHTLRAGAVDDVVDRLLGDDDRALAVAEASLPAPRGGEGDDGGAQARAESLAAALEGARTPPFGTARRIVVVRTDDAYSADEAERLAGYLADPEPTTSLVLEAPGRIPAALAKALERAGAEEVAVGTGRDATASVLESELERAGIRLDADAARLVARRLGDQAGRVPALVGVLLSAFGSGASLESSDVEPYLGEEGGVPVFELTKAVDAGDVPEALAVLQRMTGPMGMHPLQVMAVLHNHFRRIARLDDPDLRGEGDAVDALGGSVKPYPAKLAWQRARALGTSGIRAAYDLLRRADDDLRGATGAPGDAVMEVLVTRLTLLSRRATRAGAR